MNGLLATHRRIVEIRTAIACRELIPYLDMRLSSGVVTFFLVPAVTRREEGGQIHTHTHVQEHKYKFKHPLRAHTYTHTCTY